MSEVKSSAGALAAARCDLLVLAAHPLELAPLRRPWGGAEVGACRGLQLGTAAVGVGLWQAAAGTAQALRSWDCPAAVLIGSYGFFPGSGVGLLDPLVPARTWLLDLSLLRGDSALPELVSTTASFDGRLTEALRGCAPDALTADLGTTLAITTASALSSELSQRDQLRAAACVGENLEALAVAQVCAAEGLPLGALFVATNEVGPKGRVQWATHHREAAQRTADILHAFCDSGGLAHRGADDAE